MCYILTDFADNFATAQKMLATFIVVAAIPKFPDSK